MLSVTFLGTGAACPTVQRNVAALALSREGETLLFDCGEGTQRQMMRYGVGFTFSELYVTHYHADHILGIPGLLRTLGLQDRNTPVTLYGPRGAQRVLGACVTLGMDRPKFPVEIVELKPGDVLRRAEYDVHVLGVDHRADALGFALVEHERLGRFNPDRARALGIPEGPLWGKIHKGQSVSLPDGRTISPNDLVGPTRAGRRVVLSGDTRPCDAVRNAARGADLLVHEATFGADEAARAVETGHSTALEAALLAREAGVRQLALTHISARYTREAPELLTEAAEVFPHVVVAKDGLMIDVPFADAEEEGATGAAGAMEAK